MTSRVQKGSTVFRPVAKSRSRTVPSASRPASVAVEHAHAGPSSNSGLTFDSSAIHDRDSTLQENYAPSGDHEPTVIISNMPPATFEAPFITPPRAPTMPPTIQSSAPITPLSTPAAPIVITQPSSLASLRESHTTDIPHNGPTDFSPPTPALLVSSTELQETQLSSTLVESISPNVTSNGNGSTPLQETPRPPVALADSNLSHTQGEDVEQDADVPPEPLRKRKTPSADGTKKTTKRRRSTTRNAEDVENSQDGVVTKMQSRASSSTPRPRKRAPSPPPYDPDADPGEEIDPTIVTMASLCSDTGQGRVSKRAVEILSNHAAWKVKNREKRARMRVLMEAKKYGREEEDPDANPDDAQQEQLTSTPANEGGPPSSADTPAIVDDTGNGFDYTQDLATSRYNVQVRIGPNGETVIDEESLVVDRVVNDGTANYTHITESDHTKFVNSGSYGKRYRGSRWSAEETELFYDALSQYGENYELIAYVLPGRDRKSCQNKFKVEDKRNHARINHCLNNSTPIDMKTLSRMTGKDFSGPVPEIRIPTPSPTIPPPAQESVNQQPNSDAQHRVKKRSRSKSRGLAEAGVVVLGDAEIFENSFES